MSKAKILGARAYVRLLPRDSWDVIAENSLGGEHPEITVRLHLTSVDVVTDQGTFTATVDQEPDGKHESWGLSLPVVSADYIGEATMGWPSGIGWTGPECETDRREDDGLVTQVLWDAVVHGDDRGFPVEYIRV